jgi:hypothetical protein
VWLDGDCSNKRPLSRDARIGGAFAWFRYTAFIAAMVPIVLLAGAAEAEPAFCGAIRSNLAALGTATGVQRPIGIFHFFASLRRANLRQQLAQAGCARQSTLMSSLRTLCVRKCDGYYFPINSAATRKRLIVDQQVCESMYPPGQASLYIQRYSGQTDGDMTSLAGEVYAKQPFALLYRSNYDHGCASSLRKEASAGAGAVPDPQVQKRAADFSAAQNWSAAQTANETNLSDLRVRIVGPVSYYTLADPQAPVARATPPARVPGYVGVIAATVSASH